MLTIMFSRTLNRFVLLMVLWKYGPKQISSVELALRLKRREKAHPHAKHLSERRKEKDFEGETRPNSWESVHSRQFSSMSDAGWKERETYAIIR